MYFSVYSKIYEATTAKVKGENKHHHNVFSTPVSIMDRKGLINASLL